MEFRPIRTEDDLTSAFGVLESLWGASPGTREADDLEVLTLLVEDYERKAHPVPPVAPVEVLRYAIDEMGRSQAELARLLGSRARASEVLSGKRRLTLPMMQAISAAWKLPIEALLPPSTESRIRPRNDRAAA